MQLKCPYSDFGAITIIQHVLSCHNLKLWCSQFNHKCFLLDFTDLFSFLPSDIHLFKSLCSQIIFAIFIFNIFMITLTKVCICASCFLFVIALSFKFLHSINYYASSNYFFNHPLCYCYYLLSYSGLLMIVFRLQFCDYHYAYLNAVFLHLIKDTIISSFFHLPAINGWIEL